MAKEVPVFIKVDDYKDVIDVMELIKNKILEANGVLEKIRRLKAEEDAELELWNSNLEDIERKISYIDRTLFEPEDI
jgi:DNA-binding Lrp family transcriptional regulator